MAGFRASLGVPHHHPGARGSDSSAWRLGRPEGGCLRIYTDVEGSIPRTRTCARRRKLSKVSYDEMLEMASAGAKVLHPFRSNCKKVRCSH